MVVVVVVVEDVGLFEPQPSVLSGSDLTPGSVLLLLVDLEDYKVLVFQPSSIMSEENTLPVILFLQPFTKKYFD